MGEPAPLASHLSPLRPDPRMEAATSGCRTNCVRDAAQHAAPLPTRLPGGIFSPPSPAVPTGSLSLECGGLAMHPHATSLPACRPSINTSILPQARVSLTVAHPACTSTHAGHQQEPLCPGRCDSGAAGQVPACALPQQQAHAGAHAWGVGRLESGVAAVVVHGGGRGLPVH